jgi:hypothetical protein
VEVRQLVLVVSDNAHLVHRPKGRKEPHQILLMNVVFRQSLDLYAEFLRFNVLVVILLVSYGPEEMYLPDQVEEKNSQIAQCWAETHNVDVISVG